jgi:hypothetical protein
MQYVERLEDSFRHILELLTGQSLFPQRVQEVVFKILQDNGWRIGRIFNFIKQRPQMRATALEASKDIAFILHSKMSTNTLDDDGMLGLVSAPVSLGNT